MSVVAFPIERQLAVIDEVAFQLSRRDGELANKYFRMECNRLFARLRVCGIPEPDIHAEISRFTRAVIRELESTVWVCEPSDNPRGAA